MKIKRKIFYEPAHIPNEFGSGGEKRTHQILTLLKNNFEVIEPQKEPNIFNSRFKNYFSGFLLLIRERLSLKGLKNIALNGFIYLKIKRIINENPDIKFVVWESTYIEYLKYRIYSRLGIKLIYFPHNLESLVSQQKSPFKNKIATEWFWDEISIIKHCIYTVAISQEENWLLSLFNIKTDYYPYFPSLKLQNELKDIREFRKQTENSNFFLVFGSFFYSPIQKGIIELIKFLSTTDTNARFKIVGYKSEKLKEIFDTLPSSIEIVGEVSIHKLTDMLKTCKGVVINQQVSSGALTKIVELQLAGIPIVANYHSFRSYNITKGCYAFKNISEILKIVEKEKLEIPEIPDFNIEYERQIILKINSLLDSSD